VAQNSPLSRATELPSPESSDEDLVATGDHLAEAIQAARDGDLGRARTILSLPTEAASDDELLSAIVSLDRGFARVRDGQSLEALQALTASQSVLAKSGNETARFALEAMVRYQDGMARLLRGDGYGAAQILGEFAEEIEESSFHLPNLEKAALVARMEASVAAARSSMNAGDMAEVLEWVGRIRSQAEKVLSKTDARDPSDALVRAEAYVFDVEFAITLANQDLATLDFDSMRHRLSSASTDVPKLEEILEAFDFPLEGMVHLELRLYSALVDLEGMGREVILERSTPTKERASRFQKLHTSLWEMEDEVLRWGERGRTLLFTVRNARRFVENLLRTDAGGRRDFGRWSGIVALGSLVLYLIVISLTLQPTGFSAVLYVFGGVVVALVAGFGFGALKFRPLLRLYADTLKSVRARKPDERSDA
jgi:hypothetical protein